MTDAKSHPERLRELHDAVDAECRERLGKILGRPFTEEDRVYYFPNPASYAKVRRIEEQAQGHVRRLRRVLREFSAFARAHEPGSGGLIQQSAISVRGDVDKMLATIEHAIRNASMPVTTGVAEHVRPTRGTFIVDVLEEVTPARDPQTIALYTLLAAFWPYAAAAEKRFAKNGYPSPAEVIRKEAERVRQFLPK